MRYRSKAAAALMLVGVLGLTACTSVISPPDRSSSHPPSAAAGGSPPGDAATWTLNHASEAGETSQSFEVAATRVACASGVTGAVQPPVIAYEHDAVIVQINAVPLPEGTYDCQGNDAVPVTVVLLEPLGHRTLIDGGCRRSDSRTIAACADEQRNGK